MATKPKVRRFREKRVVVHTGSPSRVEERVVDAPADYQPPAGAAEVAATIEPYPWRFWFNDHLPEEPDVLRVSVAEAEKRDNG